MFTKQEAYRLGHSVDAVRHLHWVESLILSQRHENLWSENIFIFAFEFVMLWWWLYTNSTFSSVLRWNKWSDCNARINSPIDEFLKKVLISYLWSQFTLNSNLIIVAPIKASIVGMKKDSPIEIEAEKEKKCVKLKLQSNSIWIQSIHCNIISCRHTEKQ